MLTRAVSAAKVFSGPFTPCAGFLPFLYCTRTILRPYNGYQTSAKALYSDKDGKEAFTRPRRVNGSRPASDQKTRFLKGDASREQPERQWASQKQTRSSSGDAAFKVNDPWEKTWKISPPKRRSRRPDSQTLVSQDSRGHSPPQEEADPDSYAPFGGWAGPATQIVNTRKPSKLQRGASHVPFERIAKQGPHNDPHADFEDTTVTPSERRAFESLFKLHKPATAPPVVSQPKIIYKKVGPVESDSDSPRCPIIHKVGTDTPSLDSLWSSQPAPEFSEPLRRLREATLLAGRSEETGNSTAKHHAGEDPQKSPLRSDSGPTFRKVGRAEESTMGLNEDAQRDVFQMKRLMVEAESDVELWNLLHERVMRRVVDLQLDGVMASGHSAKCRPVDKAPKIEPDVASQKNVRSVGDSPEHSIAHESKATVLKPVSASNLETPYTELALQELDKDTVEEKPPLTFPQAQLYSNRQKSLEVLSKSFPKHLINTFTTLTKHFPASPLPLTLIPLIKSLGPSSAALGLSTDLYNLHLRHHWSKYSDLIAIDEILQEMNENIYEFDQITHNFVSTVLAWMDDARDGEHGPTAVLMVSMDRALRGEKAVRGWMKVMTRRRYNEELRKAQEKEAMERERLEEEENERVAFRLALETSDEIPSLKQS
jgi:hypothetical protein